MDDGVSGGSGCAISPDERGVGARDTGGVAAGLTQRHANVRKARNQMENVGGVATFGDLSGRAYAMKFSKRFTKEYAGTTVWPQTPAFNGPNDAWYRPSTKNGGWP